MDFGLSEKSEYSMDFSLFYRIDSLFQKADEATANLNLYLWYNLLLVLYKELAPLTTDKDRERLKETMFSFVPRFISIKLSIDQEGVFQIPTELYRDLMDFEISLRDIANDKGIYLRKKELVGIR